ncbi:hypothetical protein C8F04DRAFT_1197978 [Mycena alexandri]|uniref:Uncharacterized protein n=1 Tax=Mycena alexandri TaxID=1745969 RepID=A0AAD6WNE6_9AGAR|nr:hypothetical protein C8F04DRAFT_1197978 [Mycena alexandri]
MPTPEIIGNRGKINIRKNVFAPDDANSIKPGTTNQLARFIFNYPHVGFIFAPSSTISPAYLAPPSNQLKFRFSRMPEPEPEVQFGVRPRRNFAEPVRTAEPDAEIKPCCFPSNLPTPAPNNLPEDSRKSMVFHRSSIRKVAGSRWKLLKNKFQRLSGGRTTASYLVRQFFGRKNKFSSGVRTPPNAEPNRLNLNLRFRFEVQQFAEPEPKFRFGVRGKRKTRHLRRPACEGRTARRWRVASSLTSDARLAEFPARKGDFCSLYCKLLGTTGGYCLGYWVLRESYGDHSDGYEMLSDLGA